MTEGPPGSGWRVGASGVVVILLGLTIALMLFTFPAGTYAFFSGKLSSTYSAASPVTPFFLVGPMMGLLPFTVSAGTIFAFLTVVYAALILILAAERIRPARAARASLRDGPGALMSSPLLGTVVAVGFLVFTASIIDSLTTSAGVPIGGLTGDPMGVLLALTIAPLVEEVGFRVLIIGVVAFVLCFGKPLRAALGAFWRPSRALEGVALGSGVSIILWSAVAFSSVTFGACHVYCGGNEWGIGKLPDAVYGGVVLGYVYVKYGFPAAVITHWGIDYFGSALLFFGQAAYGIPWNSATEYFWQYLVDVDLLYLFGVASFLLICYLGLKKLLGNRVAGVDKPPSEGVETTL